MNRIVETILVLVSLLITGVLVVTVVANIAQMADAADRIHSGLGQPVFWTLLALFLALLVTPILLYFTLPKPLIPPAEMKGPNYERFMARLRDRLRRSEFLTGATIESAEDVRRGMAKLSAEADKVIKTTASAVFVSTAVMQNGRLDGLLVLGTQLRMVWRIAAIYGNRPSPRQLLYLYGNVASSALIADGVEDIDFAEIVAPVLTAIIPSLKGAIPGFQGVASLLANSMASGAANAFLTLRVGVMARCYCEAMSAPVQAQVRATATRTALSLIGQIAKEQGGDVFKGAWKAVKGVVGATVDSTVGSARGAVDKVATVTVDGAKAAGSAINQSWDKLKESAASILPGKKTTESG